MYYFPKLKFILALKGAIIALFSSYGLLFGILGVVMFSAIAYVFIVAIKFALSMILTFVCKIRFVMNFAVKIDYRLLQYASDEFLSEFVGSAGEEAQKAIILKDLSMLKYTSAELQREIITGNLSMLKYASAEFLSEFVGIDPHKLSSAGKEDQKEIITKDLSMLKYASAELQRGMIETDSNNLSFANEHVRAEILSEDPTKLKYLCESDQKAIIKKDPEKLKYASDDIKNDSSVIVKAMYPIALKYLSVNAQIRIALGSSHHLRYTSDSAQRKIVEINISNLAFVDESLQRAIVTSDIGKLKHASHKLQKEIINAEIANSEYGMIYSHKFKFVEDDTNNMNDMIIRYENIKSKNGLLGLDLTMQEASQDILLSVLSLPQREKPVEGGVSKLLDYYKDKLNIICAAIDNRYCLFLQAACMNSERIRYEDYLITVIQRFSRRKTSSLIVAPKLPNEPVAADKLYYYIDKAACHELYLAFKDHMPKFIEEQLHSMICKDIAPTEGGFTDFRSKCMANPVANSILIEGIIDMILSLKEEDILSKMPLNAKSEIQDLQYTILHNTTVDERFKILSNLVKDLDDKEFLSLFKNINATALVSLQNIILSSNNKEIEAIVQTNKVM